MSKKKLKNVVSYNKQRICATDLNIESYVSTDNLLQNKLGVEVIGSLPNSVNSTPKYEYGNILVSNIRPYLKKIYYSKRDGGVSSDVLTFVVNENFDSKFVYYNLFQDSFFDHMMAGSKGTKMPRGDKNQIMEFEIPDLSRSTQQKIASVLSALDDKIELNNKINTELEAMAKTLYDYWFVQFDFPDKNGKPYKSSGGKMVYNDILKREIPEGWEDCTLGDLSNLIRGVSYNKNDIQSEIKEDTIKVLRATNITKNLIDINDPVLVSNSFVKEEQVLFPYDILITMSSGSIEHIGKNGFYYLDERVAFGAFCAKIKINELFKYYVYSYMQSNVFSTIIKNECLGTNINNLNGSMVKGFKFVKPSQFILERFNSFVEPNFEKIRVNFNQNQELAQLRDWLLPMLMNGQVSVEDIDAKKDKVIPELRLKEEGFEKRKALAILIINQSFNDESFGKTKFMKLLHLIEYHVVKDNFNQRYYQHAAGPYDGAFAIKFWEGVIEDKWYRIEKLGKLERIVPGDRYKETLEFANILISEVKLEVSDFISVFKDCNYEQPEIVSTLYAVWNNRILKKEMITDFLLKQDFLAWDKQKIRYKDRLDNALDWMRENGIIPNGFGNEIKRAKK